VRGRGPMPCGGLTQDKPLGGRCSAMQQAGAVLTPRGCRYCSSFQRGLDSPARRTRPPARRSWSSTQVATGIGVGLRPATMIKPALGNTRMGCGVLSLADDFKVDHRRNASHFPVAYVRFVQAKRFSKQERGTKKHEKQNCPPFALVASAVHDCLKRTQELFHASGQGDLNKRRSCHAVPPAVHRSDAGPAVVSSFRSTPMRSTRQ